MTARLRIAYDGTDFSGWAVQPGQRTVQGELERALATIAQREITLTVAGRTDAGVHASGQVASHDGAPVPAGRLNGLLGPDVCVLESAVAAEGFDARRHATARTYRYDILARPHRDPFTRRTALHLTAPLDRAALEACAAALPGTHDFTAFTPTETYHVRFSRDVHAAAWHQAGEHLTFTVTADTFMRNMVRILVGTMIDTGRGLRTAEGFAALLEGAPRSAAGPTAPAHGLTLVSVTY